MRALMILLAVGLAAPAAAQPYQAREAQAAAAAMAARNRDITITNDLSVLQSRVETDQALSDLRAARNTPAVPTVVLGPNAPAPTIDPGKLASIPDSVLAQSNARVRAAANNRR
jgi:PHD/YefM family antitoxin component YafN of YafNO toxin-antitoxin module